MKPIRDFRVELEWRRLRIAVHAEAEDAQERARATSRLLELKRSTASETRRSCDVLRDLRHRLGHAKTDITNDIYAQALPSMQKDAAAELSSLLR